MSHNEEVIELFPRRLVGQRRVNIGRRCWQQFLRKQDNYVVDRDQKRILQAETTVSIDVCLFEDLPPPRNLNFMTILLLLCLPAAAADFFGYRY